MATLTILVEDDRVIMICLKSWEYEIQNHSHQSL